MINWRTPSKFPIKLIATGFILVFITLLLGFNTKISQDTIPGSSSPLSLSDFQFAFVKPTFTATAYQSGGFYSYYSSRTNPGSTLRVNYFNSYGPWAGNLGNTLKNLGDFEIKIGENYHEITDLDIHQGKLFDNSGARIYDVVIMGHSEYITDFEYSQLEDFVKVGGSILVLSGDAAMAEVAYDEAFDKVQLTAGHGFQFDGHNSTRTRYLRWFNSLDNRNTIFFGSDYKGGQGNFDGAKLRLTGNNIHPISKTLNKVLGKDTIIKEYYGHEENFLTHPNAHIIANWMPRKVLVPPFEIKVYELLPYDSGGGSIVHLAIFANDLKSTNSDLRQFINTTLIHLTTGLDIPWIRFPANGSKLNHKDVIIQYQGKGEEIILDGVSMGNLPSGSLLQNLEDGSHTITVIFNNLGNKRNVSSTFTVDTIPPEIVILSPEFNQTLTQGTIPQKNAIIADTSPYSLSLGLFSWNDSWFDPYMSPNYDSFPRKRIAYDKFNLSWEGDYYTDWVFYNGSSVFLVEGCDTAFNCVTKVSYFSVNELTPATAFNSLRTERFSTNQAKILINFYSFGGTPEATLDYSNDYGVTWAKTSMYIENNSLVAYLTRGTKETTLWRVRGHACPGKWVDFTVRSYAWQESKAVPGLNRSTTSLTSSNPSSTESKTTSSIYSSFPSTSQTNGITTSSVQGTNSSITSFYSSISATTTIQGTKSSSNTSNSISSSGSEPQQSPFPNTAVLIFSAAMISVKRIIYRKKNSFEKF